MKNNPNILDADTKMSQLENFKRWFIEPLKSLKDDQDAGFIFAMITFPLLERYLRGYYNHTGNNFPSKGKKVVRRSFFSSYCKRRDILGSI